MQSEDISWQESYDKPRQPKKVHIVKTMVFSYKEMEGIFEVLEYVWNKCLL